MEVSSFPSLYQDDFSHFFTLHPDSDQNPNTHAIPNPNHPLKKRKIVNDDNSNDTTGNGNDDLKKRATAHATLKEVLASLLLLEGEDKKKEEQDWWAPCISNSQLLNNLLAFDSANFKQSSETMKHFYNQLDQYGSYGSSYPAESEMDNNDMAAADELKNKKRARSCSNVSDDKSPSRDTCSNNLHSICTTKTKGYNNKVGSSPSRSGSGSGSGSAAAPSSPPHPPQRRLWVKDRSKDWWEKCTSPEFPEEEFKKAFRMSKATFDMICDELDSAITKKDTMLRAAIPVKQRVAVCIWRLATGEPLRLVSKRFGLGISTCHKLVLEVCTAIKTVLMPKFLQWPDEEKMRVVKQEFESASGIPSVGGSMYTTHIPIIAPKISVAAYFNKRHTERNQKTSYSITVQGVVDHRGVFTDVCIGYPGGLSDDKILEESALYKRAGRALLGGSGSSGHVWVVGTSGYPLLDWVLVPYTHQNLTWAQHAFNEKIGEVQKVAKDAFARLKARWSCMQKRTEVKLQDLPVVLGACCVLHNICEMRNEGIDTDLNLELVDDDMVPDNSLRSNTSIQARDHLAHNLLHHGLATNSFL